MNNYINHHGVLGMRGGVRRYQNKDGTLTPVGKQRLDKQNSRSRSISRKQKTEELLGKRPES